MSDLTGRTRFHVANIPDIGSLSHAGYDRRKQVRSPRCPIRESLARWPDRAESKGDRSAEHIARSRVQTTMIASTRAAARLRKIDAY